MMERLDFTLPDFTRLSWVSDRAQEAWGPRLERISAAWQEVEWLAVAAGVRRCAVTAAAAAGPERAARWAARGLQALPVEVAADGPRPSDARLVVGRPQDVSDFRGAWQAGDQEAMGRLLGSPPCCHEFFRRVWVDEGLDDTTWPMAVATGPVPPGSRSVEVAGPPQSNILWRWVGVRAVPHLPCRFDCPATVAAADAFAAVGRGAGYGTEMDWLREVLDWPVEWSALHGIAEVKTPVFKLSTRTDATAGKYVVRRRGTRYPAEGAQGLAFPYQMSRPPLLTLSPGFRRGLDNPLPPEAPAPRPAPPAADAPRAGATILDETLRHLTAAGEVAGRAIRSLHLGPYFTVVELDDGSVGACMSYYDTRGPGLETARREIAARTAEDPLLLDFLFGAGRPGPGQRPVVECLRATVVSALSARLLGRGGDATFTATGSPPFDPFAGARRALVIGFGGYMDALAHAGHVEELHIRDLSYGAGQAKMDATVARYRQLYPRKTITIADGRDTAERLREVDAAAITGSALCNGTLDGLLDQARGGARVVVQGQSAAIHPRALFDRGVRVVVTTLKPPELVRLAAADPSGESMRPLLEGGLPQVYLLPRGDGR